MKIYVISGGPGTGKTTTIKYLRKEFEILPESAREVATSDSRFAGKHITDIDKLKFHNGIYKNQLDKIEELKTDKKSLDKIIFSDRGLGDTIAYFRINNLKVPKELMDYAKKFRYDGIFILSKLNFYRKDNLRQESEEEQKIIHDEIIKTYKELGYEPVIIPTMEIKERAKFIKNYLKL